MKLKIKPTGKPTTPKTATIVTETKTDSYVQTCYVPTWAIHIDCPYCNNVMADWLTPPFGKDHTCPKCNKEFYVASDSNIRQHWS